MQSTPLIDLLSFGNTIVDMEYHVSDDTLQLLGIDKGSMTLIDKDRRDELYQSLGDPVHLCSGGSVANSLFVSKQFGLNVHHFGAIGTDNLSQFIVEDYDSNGIQESFDHNTWDGDTGCCLVLITPDGERTMLTYLGVSNQFKDISAIKPLISSSSHVFIEGYLVSDDACYEAIISELIPFAKSTPAKLILTLSDAGLISFFSERFHHILNLGMDVVFCNRQEAATISGASSMNDIQAFFSPLSGETIVTDGDNGAHILINDSLITSPTTPIDPVDTTGAGDAFAGTYIAKRHRQASIEESAKQANRASGIVISNLGARPLALIHYLSTSTPPC